MDDAIFLSAGIPDARRGPEYAATADSVAIAAAVSALTYVVLGRRLLVWGGHPAITPMVWSIAEGVDVDYSSWVTLFQSEFFQDEFPQENAKFKNVILTPAIGNNRDLSLMEMRFRMLSSYNFTAAVFVGGMQGIWDEVKIVDRLHPKAHVIPVASAGGASLEIAKQRFADDRELFTELDYIKLFHRKLGISAKEPRTAQRRNPDSA